ncbi:MAG: hydroxymethylbilane synthase [Caldilineaceae bacterium]
MKKLVTIGTRTSDLAMWQTNHIIDRLQAAWPGLTCRLQPFVTQGDKTLDKPLPVIGGKGLFTAELERSLLAGEIDLAVHSLKDLPVEDAPGLTVGAITSRADVRDALVARHGWTLATLPQGAVVGTSSTRRAAQLQARRPDLLIRSIRGNVDTRVRKVLNGDYDAAVLALAGLERLGLDEHITERLTLAVMLPAPGQGALAVQCRADDQAILALLAAIDEGAVRAAVTAERAFLHGLGGGCSAPVAAYAQVTEETGHRQIQLQALVGSADGRQIIRVRGAGSTAPDLGERLAKQALQEGAATLLSQKSGFDFGETSARTLSRAVETTGASTKGQQTASPLHTKRVVVTRPQEQSATLLDKLTALGATPLLMPTIRIEPLTDLTALDDALRASHQYGWLVVTSVNSVAIVGERLCACGLTTRDLAHLQIVAVGPATADALDQYGLTPTFVPERFTADEIAAGLQALIGDLSEVRILLPQAEIARQKLAEALTEQGAQVDVIPIYQTLPAPLAASALAELQQGVDILTFTSGSTVRNFVQGLSLGGLTLDCLHTATIACIGLQTAAAAQELGLHVDLVATEHTIDGLVDALVAHCQATHSKE